LTCPNLKQNSNQPIHNSVQDTKQISLYLIVAGDTVQYPEQLSDISTELQL
jgi:hypothetical protein